MNIFRTLIVPAGVVDSSRLLSGALAGKSGEGMYLTPLSPTGQEPATHYISSGVISSDFGDILPLTDLILNEVGEWVEDKKPGKPDKVVAMAQALKDPLSVTQAQIEGIFGQVDVSKQAPFTAMARLGLKMIESEI